MFTPTASKKKLPHKRPRSSPPSQDMRSFDEGSVQLRIKQELLNLRTLNSQHGAELMSHATTLKRLFAECPHTSVETNQAAVLEIVEMPLLPVVKYDVHILLAACGLPDVDSTDERSDDEDEEEEEDEVYEELDKKVFNEGISAVVAKVQTIADRLESVNRTAIQNMADSLYERLRHPQVWVRTEEPQEELQLTRQNAFVADEAYLNEVVELPQPPPIDMPSTIVHEPEVCIEESLITPRDQTFPANL